jgi:hypothetical protein
VKHANTLCGREVLVTTVLEGIKVVCKENGVICGRVLGHGYSGVLCERGNRSIALHIYEMSSNKVRTHNNVSTPCDV